MALTDTKLRNLKPTGTTFSLSDAGGLYIEVTAAGKKTWKLRYRIGGRGSKQEKVVLGEYPTYSLSNARTWRDECKTLIGRSVSPMALKRGDPLPSDAAPAVKELAELFIQNWCHKTKEKQKAKEAEAKVNNTVEALAWEWFHKVAEPANSNPRNIKRALEKDVIPILGDKQLNELGVGDVIAVTDRIKNRGSDHMALQTRNVMKRMFAYALSLEKMTVNPAAAIDAKYIATAKSRDVALSQDEIGRLLRVIYQSNMNRSNKLALHLLIICMVRKSELIEARWEELDLEKAEWSIPSERMKKSRSHLVPLSQQALAIFEELKGLSSGSDWVFPSRNTLTRPISKSALNKAVSSLDHDIKSFVIHDFRRTASTHLHEAGFNSDWIEKALAHEAKGIRGVYNRAQYAEQRREMLQWWADLVDNQINEGKKVVIGRFGKAIEGD